MQEYPGGPTLPALPNPSPRRRNWLATTGSVVAVAVSVGVGAVLGANYLSTAQAAGAATLSTTTYNSYEGSRGFAGPSSSQGQCESLAVSSVSGSTITAKAQDGSTVTVTTTSRTTYTLNGKLATMSDIKAGVTISVMGMHNSDGSITATSIDIR